MSRPYVEQLETLAYGYEEMALHGEEYLRVLGEAKKTAETIRLLWKLTGIIPAEELEEAKGKLSLGSYRDAYNGLLETCRKMLEDYAASKGFTIEADECPDPRLVELLENLWKAAGPTYPVVAALLAPLTGKSSELFANTYRVARMWRELAEGLSKLYTAAHILEKNGYIRAEELLRAEAEKLSGLTGFPEKYETVLSDSETLYRASKKAVEAEKTLRRLYSLSSKNPVLAKPLGEMLAELESRREYVKRSAHLSKEIGDPEPLAKALEEYTSIAERAAKGLAATASRLTGKTVENLEEAVEVLAGLDEGVAGEAVVLLAVALSPDPGLKSVAKTLAGYLGIPEVEAAKVLAEECYRGLINCSLSVPEAK